jgi:hypothetical protein
MRIFVEHDDSGNIVGVAASAGGPNKTVPLPGPGNTISEVEAPEVKDLHDHETLRTIRGRYLVRGREADARLVPREG